MPRTRITIETERATDRGWAYDLRVHWPDGSETPHEVALAWVDHDHWSGGRRPPSEVIERMLTWLIECCGRADLPERLDAATIRRWHPEIDEQLPALL